MTSGGGRELLLGPGSGPEHALGWILLQWCVLFFAALRIASSPSSSTGFSAGVDVDSFNGSVISSYILESPPSTPFPHRPSPLWRDLLRAHEQKPIHVLVGGGDQIYCDPLAREPEMQTWITSTTEEAKVAHPLREDMSSAMDRFFFNHVGLSTPFQDSDR